ncbi:MAG: DUF763 domain-containing protein [Actinomycetota bacterium]|nr:DUF763 domain-containing protein [Actinomycetota bacterium]
MAKKTGTADLPLHYGSAPAWLFSRMRALAQGIILLMSEEFGPDEFISKMSDPVWFQAFGCLLGFDWHSSGLTTTVCGAVKEALNGIGEDTGIYAAGGKGGTSRRAPAEIERKASEEGLDVERLIYASRMSAKVDSSAVQDGYQIYHHMFFFTKRGKWAVVQQGMNTLNGMARRYHWLSERIDDFTCEPHAAVCCDSRGEILNMVARESREAQVTCASISCEKPEKVVRQLENIKTLVMPERHQIYSGDINPERLESILLKTYERQPENFEILLGMKGVGPKTIRALALVSELVYEEPVSRRDPARFSFAHGGKDGYPYPVDRKTYDSSIEFLEKAVRQTHVGRTEKLDALKRLRNFDHLL